jgi:hypothetical protein
VTGEEKPDDDAEDAEHVLAYVVEPVHRSSLAVRDARCSGLRRRGGVRRAGLPFGEGWMIARMGW